MKTKNLTLLIFLLFAIGMSAQKSNRKLISGKVSNESNEVEGISIYNEVSGLGTITNEEGAFQIEVQEGDVLLFSALQFQKFRVIVDRGIMKSLEMNVYMNEVITALEEVTVTPYDLTGNVRVDVARVKVHIPKIEEDLASQKTYESFEFKADYLSPVVNEAVSEPDFRNGINMVNVFRKIFLTRQADPNATKLSMTDEMKKLYGNEFFQNNLNIPEEEIINFVSYCETQGLNDDLIKNNNQLELLNFLVVRCAAFKAENHTEVQKN